MSDTTVWLTELVIPREQIRQWVLTLPWGLRVRAGYDRQLCVLVVDTFIRELQRSYRWRAKRLFGLSCVEDAFTGMVTVIQRFDSALRLNVHLHTLALDGVYVKSDDGGLRFLRLRRPSADEVYNVAFRTAKKVVAMLGKRGRSADGALHDEGESEIEPALLSCYDIAGSDRAPKTRIVDGPRLGKGECAVVVDGFNVYAGDSIDGRDRQRIERMCRYFARPPIAMERLTGLEDRDLRYELKKAWRDGTRFVTLDPYELMARICAMVPPPRFHMLRFHGVLAPNSGLREQVVASARPYVPPNVERPTPLQFPLFGNLFEQPGADVSHKRRKPWAWLLRHVFAIDVNVCPKCIGRMKWRQVALTADAIREGLARAGLARGPPKRKRAPLGQLLVAVCEDASGVNGAASCVSLRSYLPAPMYTCVRLSRKIERKTRRRPRSDEERVLDARESTTPMDDAWRRRRVNGEILPLFSLRATRAASETSVDSLSMVNHVSSPSTRLLA